MHRSYIPSACFLLLLSIQLLSALPLQCRAFTNEDVDVLKVSLVFSVWKIILIGRAVGLTPVFDRLQFLLERLEEAIPASMQDQQQPPERPKLEDAVVSDEEEGRPQPPQVDMRDYLSARDLKNVRFDSGSKRSSACFGRRLDRIGSMSTLGCNTVGRSSRFLKIRPLTLTPFQQYSDLRQALHCLK